MALDRSKLQLQSTLIQPPQPEKKVEPVAQKKSEIAPVQSSLPQIQPSQAQTAPATSAQVASARRDPRFAKAIASKYQTELQQRQQQLQQQQQQYQQKIQEAGVTGDSGRVSSLLQTITAETDPARIQQAEQEYQALMRAQAGVVQEPEEYKRAQAKLAALARMSGAGIAKLYGESAPGVVAPATYYDISSPELEKQRVLGKSALRELEQKSILTEAMKQANIQEAEALRGLAKEKITGAEQSLMAGLTQKQKQDVEAKNAAQKMLKESVYLGKTLSDADVKFITEELGLTEDQLSNIGYIDTRGIEGLEKFGSVSDLDQLSKTISKMEESGIPLTPEQKNLADYYKKIESSLSRTQDLDALAYATPEQKAQINALKRLTGQTELSEEQIQRLGKGETAGKLGDLSQFAQMSADIDLSQIEKTAKQVGEIQSRKQFGPEQWKNREVAGLYTTLSRSARAFGDDFMKTKADEIDKVISKINSLVENKPSESGDKRSESFVNRNITDLQTKLNNLVKEIQDHTPTRSKVYSKGRRK